MPTDGPVPGSTVCIIPVRGGSKGFPRKNLAEIAPGTSLLQHSIAQALRCFPRTDVIVSTEDEALASQAADAGMTLHDRPEKLAADETTTAEVVRHLLDEFDEFSDRFSQLMILQVTSPLREDEHVRQALAAIQSGQFDSVISGYRGPPVHPAKMYLEEEGAFRPVLSDLETTRRQDLPSVLVRNGAIFATTINYFKQSRKLVGGKTHIVEMPIDRSVDIDCPDDLARAQRMMAK